jgi:hypothetical protein
MKNKKEEFGLRRSINREPVAGLFFKNESPASDKK